MFYIKQAYSRNTVSGETIHLNLSEWLNTTSRAMDSFETCPKAESNSGLNSTEILLLHTVRPALSKHTENYGNCYQKLPGIL